jgi:two-component sensor histidine kinase
MLGVDQAIPAGVILNELISNALKHGFLEGRSSSIAVGDRLARRSVLPEVRDSGVGLPENFPLNRTKSLGLRIVQILARQLNGTCEAESASGTVFRVMFPGPANEVR